MGNSHRRRNSIDRIRIGRDWLNGEENIRVGVTYKNKVLFFRSLVGNECGTLLNLILIPLLSFANWLEAH